MNLQKIELLRFGGYVGVSLNGLLVPLLVFQLTHSASLAGFSLFIEWLPKMGFYLFGGALSRQLSGQRAHRQLELYRLGALASLAGAAAGWLPWQAVAVAAAVYQCTNAVSNILFEVLVTRHWSDAQQAIGHARLMRADLAAGVLATGLGILTGNTVILLGLGLLAQGLVSSSVWRWSERLYQGSESPARCDWQGLLKLTIIAVRAVPGSLWRLSMLSFAMGLPIALLYSALPFVFEQAFPDLTLTPRQLSGFLLIKAVTSLAVAQLVKHGLARFPHSEHRWAIGGALLLMAGLALSLSATGIMLVVGVLLAGWSGYLYSPWARTRRQAGMPADALRLPMTGLLISVEAASYLVGAALLAGVPGGILESLKWAGGPLFVALLVFFVGSSARVNNSGTS